MTSYVLPLAATLASLALLAVWYLGYSADRDHFMQFRDELEGLRALPLTRDELPASNGGYVVWYKGMLNEKPFAFSASLNAKRRMVGFQLKFGDRTRVIKSTSIRDVRGYLGAVIRGKFEIILGDNPPPLPTTL